jgi:predicted DNA-binding protein YlxM (UPF0122 family)
MADFKNIEELAELRQLAKQDIETAIDACSDFLHTSVDHHIGMLREKLQKSINDMKTQDEKDIEADRRISRLDNH